MASAGLLPVPNETKATASRITREGRKITYVMEVIQQPERARACGSGAKSSADRRPVDPPPIVDVRVYEGANAENDITFKYNANFFLFATLENSRTIGPGRQPPVSGPAFPVLTGSPVAGMAYLDRPSPAGYFIFPDLSVRHEGKYRLQFSLFEDLKEAKDLDPETPQNANIQQSTHVSHRLSVSSQLFQVYSAKKFPGLSESTSLSKMVAEQGCRVRIRRDVRMRRRDTKGNHEYDNYDEDREYQRSRGSRTPDIYAKPHPNSTPQIPLHDVDRPRSVSNASQSSHVTIRRQSAEQIHQSYQQAGAPQTPQSMYASHIAAGNWSQPAPVNGYMSQHAYSHQSYQPGSNQFSNFATPSYSSYEAHNNMRHGSTSEYPAPPTGPPPPVPTSHTMYQNTQPSLGHFGQADVFHRSMPPLQPATLQPYGSGSAHSPLEPKHDSISPYQPQNATVQPEHPQYYGNTSPSIAPPKLGMNLQSSGATKRTFGSTFDNSHHMQPLRQGARPPSSPVEQKFYAVDPTDEDPPMTMEEAAMSYRRADGTQRRRRLPMVA